MSATLRVTVVGEPSTQLLLRTVNLLTLRGLPPKALRVRTSATTMRILADLANPGPAALETLLSKLEAMVEVANVSAGPRCRNTPEHRLTFSD